MNFTCKTAYADALNGFFSTDLAAAHCQFKIISLVLNTTLNSLNLYHIPFDYHLSCRVFAASNKRREKKSENQSKYLPEGTCICVEMDRKSMVFSICFQMHSTFHFHCWCYTDQKNPSSQIKCRRTFIDYVVMDVLEHIVSFHWCFQHKNSHHLISSGNLAKHIPSLSKATATHPYTPCNFAPAQCSYIFVLNDFQIERQCSFIANDCMQHMQFSPRTVGKPCLYRIYNCNSFPIWVHVFLLMFIWETITKTHTRKRSHSLRWCSFMQFVVAVVVAYAWTVHDEQSIQQNSLSILWIA